MSEYDEIQSELLIKGNDLLKAAGLPEDGEFMLDVAALLQKYHDALKYYSQGDGWYTSSIANEALESEE